MENTLRLVCDFCGLKAAWLYRCMTSGMSMAMPGLEILLISDENWKACEVCKGIVDTGDREALVERGMQKFKDVLRDDLKPYHMTRIKEMLLQYHENFWETHEEQFPLPASISDPEAN